jgi:hypothetical protein
MLAALPALAGRATCHRDPRGCARRSRSVSLADDVRSLPIAVRLPAHFAAAAVAILAIAGPRAAHPGWALSNRRWRCSRSPG